MYCDILDKNTFKIANNVVCLGNGGLDMDIVKYPMAGKLNKETGELNAWLPDWTILARAKTNQDLRLEVQKLVREFFLLAMKNDVLMPLPSNIEEFKSRWREDDGYSVEFIGIDVT